LDLFRLIWHSASNSSFALGIARIRPALCRVANQLASEMSLLEAVSLQIPALLTIAVEHRVGAYFKPSPRANLSTFKREGFHPGQHMGTFHLSTILMSSKVQLIRVQPGKYMRHPNMTTQTRIRSEITGTVWKILARPGDTLQAEDTLMVLESMKMEIPVLAPEAGRLVELCVAEGAPVRDGQELALFEEASA